MSTRRRNSQGPASGRKANRGKHTLDPSRETPRTAEGAADERAQPDKSAPFPIVGIGASAGGLEAFTQLLRALPLDTGLGFVLVQHLDPEHESALVQILGRATALPVNEIKHDEPVQPNHVYVIPRDTNLSIVNRVFKLHPRQRTRTPHRPIDSFFESLAQDIHELAVGVVLSGTASDGTVGLEAIKAEGGITFAQDGSAKYESMPRSAVAAGCVDLVLSPEEIAKELARIARHPYIAGQARISPAEIAAAPATPHEDDETRLPSGDRGSSAHAGKVRARAEADFEERAEPEATKGARRDDRYSKILLLLRNHSGVDFSLYKSTTVQRRITRRLVLNKQNTLTDYADFLRGNTKELDALYSDVLISVTSFFRNPETYDVLKQKVFPALLKQRSDQPLRCWVLGCSTGQEAYSIAMAFLEAADNARTLQIFATDLNDALLEKARHGVYAKSLAQDITPERLRRFFIEEGGGYRVSKALRDMVVFARQNLIADPPFSRLDLISCRNLLIYLEPSLQKQAMPTFHYALKPGGFLLLGASESVGGFTDLFEPVDKKHKIYSKKSARTPAFHLPLRKEYGEKPFEMRAPVPQPGKTELPGGPRGELNAQREADRIILNLFAPAAVLVNAELQVLQFRGPTGAFLEPPTGKASFDVLKMARKGLMLPLRSVIQQAKKENKAARRENVRVNRNGKTRTVSLEVIPLKNLPERCFLILFEEAEAGRAPGERRSFRAKLESGEEPLHLPPDQEASRIAELETEIGETREYLQSIQEEHEAANEELQAANEEVQSANEELQSVNEELETSKEELESANEELTTVNEEMSNRNVELNRLNNDLVNLQTSTNLAVLLLGRDLVIRRFSPQAQKQFDLLITDQGRPISNIRHNLVLGDAAGSSLDLEGLSTEVISTVREQERDVRDRCGRWYLLRVRPYMTLDNKVDGAVLVLVDIDAIKHSEETIAAARDYAQNTVEAVREPLLVLDHAMRVESANRAFFRVFGITPTEAAGKSIHELCGGQWDIPQLRNLLQEILTQGTAIEDFPVEHDVERLGRRAMLLNARRIPDPKRKSERILVAMEDITERRRAEEALAHLAAIVASSDDAIISKDLDGIITSWNDGAQRIFGYAAEEVIGKPLSLLIPPDHADEEPEILRRIRLGEKVGHFDTVRKRKDGSLVDVSVTVSPIRRTDGSIFGAAKIARDITKRKRAEEELRESHDRLRSSNTELRESEDKLRQYGKDLAQADRRKNEFLAMLGHELRNPLSALVNAISLLGMAADDRARSEQLRAMMGRQTRRIVTLLDQLLDVSRLISGKVKLSNDRVDLVEVVRAAVETVRPLVETHKHELTVTLPPETSAFVMGDAVRLTQVVENLLTNAIKYTNEGGRIDIAIEWEQDKVRTIVRDTGIGVAPQFLPHIFEVFTQAPQTLDRAKGGMGLGLPLVRRLVDMHGGEVSASSPGLGHGSEFIVTLPLQRESRSKGRLEGAPAPIKPGTIRPCRILVVDDERDTAQTLAELLEDEGHKALVVHNGPAALEAVGTSEPDVVLLDLGLPGMDGYEVARRLRETYPARRMLLIAVTGYQSDADRLKQAGFDQHLIKPPAMQKLSALLAAWNCGEGAIP